VRPSLISRIMSMVFKIINFKKIVEKRAYKQKPKPNKSFIPKRIERKYLTEIQSIDSKEIVTFGQKEIVANNHIIFLHGGAYIFDISPSHWKLASKIVDNCSCRITVVDYPLAPEFNYKHTFNMVQNTYDYLKREYSKDNFILMGDSAGGGLALAFMQKIIEEQYQKIPIKCILLSPWLDLTMSNTEIEKQENTDHVLSMGLLKYAAKKYSNEDNMEHYLLSPINGTFKNIPKTIIFYGTEELYNADCNKIKTMLAGNKNIIFREYKNMQHDWVLFQIPESEMVIEEICEFIDS
jgi:epsilon-lactone hydrolase